ncbi:MAG: M48 family metallopeptidase [bacterium]
MKKQIILQNKAIDYILRKSKRARYLRLAVYCGGMVVVTLPQNFQETSAERFIREKTDWLLSKINFFRQFKERPIARYGQRDYLKHKDQAQSLAKEKVLYFNQFYGYKFNKINIKNQKSRWGSCSRKGNLNFNFKILFLSEKLRDYIIVHELCHLKEFNHSRSFWGLVAKTIPKWPELKKELKTSALG